MDEAPASPPPKLIPRLAFLLFILGLTLQTSAQAGPEAAASPPSPETAAITEPDLWQRLRSGLALPDMDHPTVRAHEDWFVRHPNYLATAFRRARPFLFHIVEELEARGLPAELALLPVIESAYDPGALSNQQAAGIWQFIPSTGKVYGLSQNGWYDGRRDVVTATEAALDYLERLQDLFGSWELALAAYNCGEGCVARATSRNRVRGLATDFLSVDLPAQTREYVPRLLAVRNLIRQPERYGLSLEPIPNRPYFREVSLPYPIEARTAARLAEIDMDTLLTLNPGFRRRVIHVDYQEMLLLPVDKLDTFRANLDAEQSHRIRLHRYAGKKGELLSRIADRFNVTVDWLKAHNPLDLRQGKLAHAQTLMLPPAAKPAPARVARAPAKLRTHTVRRGDTLAALAKRYKVTVADIREYNGTLDVLRPGTKLQIPVES